ncbi:2'-5' RNA ligase superfamily protein [Cryobacterium psychrophilum]|nr:2'-5' RNA ligase superfamily protein [Cryobacterium psychrophilum]
MPLYTQHVPRLVVVLPLSPLQVGDQFPVNEWPLHITVLAPFRTDAAPGHVAALIAAAASAEPAIPAVVGRKQMFGRRHDVPVSVMVENEALTRLHEQLVAAVGPLGESPQEPAFTGAEFTPHITFKNHGRMHAGDTVLLEQIAVVDMAPRSAAGGRTVLATVVLSGSTRGDHEA